MSRCLGQFRRGRWPGAGLAVAACLFTGLIAGPSAAAGPPTQATPEPALWVIRDADSTVYLFGTVHLLRGTTVWETPRVLAAFDAAQDIWFEVNDTAGAEAAPARIAAYGLSDRPLSSLLTPEERRALSAAAGRAGLSAEQLEPLRPWLAGMMVGNAPMLDAGYVPEFSVETRLRERAATGGKVLRGLETMDDQLGYLAELPVETQLDLLRYMIQPAEGLVADLDASVAAWLVGDMAALERAAVLPMRRESEALHEAMLVRRSTLLADYLQTLLDGSGVAFVALGAGYLAGEDSVQSVLEDRGVRVEAAP